MKKISPFFILLFFFFVLPVSAQSDDTKELKLILKELQKITGELRDIKAIFNAPRGKRRPTEAVVSIDDDPMLGNKEAKVTLVEFTDYQCPFCGSFFKETFKKIKKNYIDTGKIRYILRDFPLPMHNDAKKAAEAANCAKDQNRYWKMHHKLFTNQKNLKVADLKNYASSLGLDTKDFNACLDSGQYNDEVKKDFSDGANIGISGTPSFIIGKTNNTKMFKGKMLHGAVPFARFKETIDGFLK